MSLPPTLTATDIEPRLERRRYSVEESVELIFQIHQQLEAIEDYRLKLKWWMGFVVGHTDRPHGVGTDIVDQIVEELRSRHSIRTSRSILYECLKLYDGLSGDYDQFRAWIERRKKLFGRPVYWYDVQKDLLGGRNNPEVIGREAADERDYLDAERALEAIERIVLRAREGNEEAAGVLEALRQSIQGLLLLESEVARTPRSEEYLVFIRCHPCLVCGRPAEAHHAVGRRGLSVKPSDFGSVPLCRLHHVEMHRTDPTAFSERYRLNLAEAALNLLHRYLTGLWLTSPLREVPGRRRHLEASYGEAESP